MMIDPTRPIIVIQYSDKQAEPAETQPKRGGAPTVSKMIPLDEPTCPTCGQELELPPEPEPEYFCDMCDRYHFEPSVEIELGISVGTMEMCRRCFAIIGEQWEAAREMAGDTTPPGWAWEKAVAERGLVTPDTCASLRARAVEIAREGKSCEG